MMRVHCATNVEGLARARRVQQMRRALYYAQRAPGGQLDGLGKFKLKNIFKPVQKIVKAVAKPVVKVVQAHVDVVKKLAPAVKKLAPLALVAGTAFYAPQLLPAVIAARGMRAPKPMVDESGAVMMPPASITTEDALAIAAQAYGSSRLPTLTPAQPSYSPEPDEYDYEQPRRPAPQGAALGDLKVPLIAAATAAAIAVPLLVVTARRR